MKFALKPLTLDDAEDLVQLHLSANHRLTEVYGEGPWSGGMTTKGVLFAMKHATALGVRLEGQLIATLSISTRKPWAIDPQFFRAGQRPLYLTGMAVDPASQRKGIGRACIQAACQIAQAWPADSIRLDAWDHEAGASDFYRKCGFAEVGRATYRGAVLIYFEMVL